MRLIAQLPDVGVATRFGDYLTATGVANQVEQAQQGFSVWVHDDDHVDRAKRELEIFLTDPLASRYSQANDAAQRVRADQEKREQKLQRNFIDVRKSWGGAAQGRLPLLTIFLIGASCAITLISNFGDRGRPITSFLWIDGTYHRIAALPDSEEISDEKLQQLAAILTEDGDVRFLNDVRRGEVWRLVSPMFLHLGVMHLVFNMWWLFDLGGMVERRKGIGWLALVVISTALASNLVQYAWDGPFFGGMSGVVYALFGYAWMKGKFQPHEGIGVAPQTVTIMLVWLVACMTGFLGDIANAAHVVGLLGGMALGHASGSWKKVRRALRGK